MTSLSLVTIVRNDFLGLQRTISSIDKAVSSLTDISVIEHVIIDGSSSDGFAEFIDELTHKRPISSIVISEADNGIYDAMNKGVFHAKGEGIVYLNAGDEMHPDCDFEEITQDISDILQSPYEPGLVYCSTMRVGRREFLIKPRRVDANSPRMPGIHQAMIYKRSVLLSEPFDAAFVICGDYENFARLMVKFGGFRPVQRSFAIFYAGGRSSQLPLQLFRESKYVSSKYFGLSSFKKMQSIARLVASLVVFQIVLAFERKHLD